MPEPSEIPRGYHLTEAGKLRRRRKWSTEPIPDDGLVPMIAYEFPLREDVRARVRLPEDLTEAEAERLCGMIRALAFSEQEAGNG